MSKIENPPAFPRDRRHPGHNGMDLRDWFAGQAIISAFVSQDFEGSSYNHIAGEAYALADAMLAERNRAPEATHG